MAMIPAGNFTERILVKALAYRLNEIGEQELVYQPIDGFPTAIPATAKFVKSFRAVDVGQMWEATRVIFTTRYSQSLLNVRRIEWQGKKYDVDGMPNGDRIQNTITYSCNLHDDGTDSEEIEEEEESEEPEQEE